MTTQQLLTTTWNWNPWVSAICVAAVVAHGLLYRFRSPRKLAWLLAALATLVLALDSPLNVLATGYLFSAHMAQHLLLLLIVPAFVLLSLPRVGVPKSFEQGQWRWLHWLLRHPFATWLMGVGGMWFWHDPRLCDAAVTNIWVHDIQYVSLVLLGTGFWWPIIGPWERLHIQPLGGMLYLFSACVGCSILGILLTFAPSEMFAMYLHPVDRLGILPLIRNQWGVTPARDQQLGGLIMWVPACMIYLSGVFGMLFRWYSAPGEEPFTAPGSAPSAADPAAPTMGLPRPGTSMQGHHA